VHVRRGSPAAVLGCLLCVVLVLSGCASFASTISGAQRSSTAAAAVPASTPPAPIRWTDCTEQIKPLVAGQPGADRPLTFACGRTDVPISYRTSGGPTMPLFLVKVVLAGQTGRIGSLLVNPGGPGASGADAAISLALTMPTDVLQRFDLVGFDPRGVGLSTPVECLSDDLKDQLAAAEPRPLTDAQQRDAFALTQRVADTCATKYGSALGTFNTADSARDMDRLRRSLGDAKLSYLGYSYGTTLGSVYAELFPDNIRAMVLDGDVDPDNSDEAEAEAAAAGLEKSFDAFAANCTGLPSGCPVGADPRAFVQALLAQAQTSPIPSTEQGETRTATPGIVLTAVQAAMYDTGTWPQLAQALAAAQKGDAQGLFSLADSYNGRLDNGTYTNLVDANLAINCADTAERYDQATVRARIADWNAKYPLFGASTAMSLYSCTVWKATRTPLPKRAPVTSAPVLVVGNTGDPVTPYPGAQDMARDLGSTALLTWQGQGHTSYPKTPCVTAAVDSYLVNLTVPPAGLTCPPTG
jgi:pimeloyl-ACP methyl ester carboxylesterase